MGADEGVVGQMRIGAADAIDVAGLARAEHVVRGQAARAANQPLPPQHFLDTRDAAGEAMFPLTTFAGDTMTRQWAEDRQRWEPLFEAIQMKGQSESHPSLSTTDEFAVNYELWDRGNLTQTPKKPGMIQYEYLREALKNGLKVEQDLGANPFKYGMAGGTDTHNGLVAAEEDNFFAKFPSAEPNADRWNENAMQLAAARPRGEIGE